MDTNFDTSAIDESRDALAAKLAVSSSDVRTVKADWVQLMQDGLVVSLHIRRWRMTARLTLQDLGLDDEENAAEQAVLDEIMQVGEKYLFPAKYKNAAASIDAGARQAIKKYGYKTYWGYFVPATAWVEFKDQMEEYKARYLALRDEIYSNWGESVGTTLYNFRVAARAAYKRLVRVSGSPSKYGSEFDFAETYVQRIENLIPKAGKVYDSFAFEMEMNYIPLPALLQEDDLRLEEKRAALRAERAESDAVRAMRLDMLRNAQQQKQELISQFEADVMTQLQETAYNAALDVLEALKRNDGEVQAKSIVQLKNMLDTVKRLNFYGDTDIDSMMQEVRSKLQPSGRDGYDGAAIKRTLTEIAVQTRSKLAALGAKVRSGRDADLPEMGDAMDKRSTRKGLGVQLDIELGGSKEQRGKRAL